MAPDPALWAAIGQSPGKRADYTIFAHLGSETCSTWHMQPIWYLEG
jgi:hypothetical protein